MDEDNTPDKSSEIDEHDPGIRLRELTERLEDVSGNIQNIIQSMTGREVPPPEEVEEPQDLEQIVARIRVVGENLQKIVSSPQEEPERIPVGAASDSE